MTIIIDKYHERKNKKKKESGKKKEAENNKLQKRKGEKVTQISCWLLHM